MLSISLEALEIAPFQSGMKKGLPQCPFVREMKLYRDVNEFVDCVWEAVPVPSLPA